MISRWYKDRDFPEVKVSNADIVAVIERPEHLARVIADHNETVDALADAQHRLRLLDRVLTAACVIRTICVDSENAAGTEAYPLNALIEAVSKYEKEYPNEKTG